MNASQQLTQLGKYPVSFSQKIVEPLETASLKPLGITTLQINVGKKCNQACHHCHVEASPLRTEMMEEKTIDRCLEIINNSPSIKTVDITGGAPEMNPHFEKLVVGSREAGKQVLDRCNLTILEEPGFEHLYQFLSQHQVDIVASLPHFAASRTDSQRGRGVFDRSIVALKKLNERGYGRELVLNLVYNPSGLFLSGNQKDLEKEFKYHLKNNFQIEFNQLYCLNNMPINRFLSSLVKKDKFESYMEVLVNAFNPSTIEDLMCRHLVSIDYLGNIYDCDFNQMLEMRLEKTPTIWDWEEQEIKNRSIKLANHCFGCTAGAGSSCGGELVGG